MVIDLDLRKKYSKRTFSLNKPFVTNATNKPLIDSAKQESVVVKFVL